MAIWVGSVLTEKMENSEWRKKLREEAEVASRKGEEENSGLHGIAAFVRTESEKKCKIKYAGTTRAHAGLRVANNPDVTHRKKTSRTLILCIQHNIY